MQAVPFFYGKEWPVLCREAKNLVGKRFRQVASLPGHERDGSEIQILDS